MAPNFAGVMDFSGTAFAGRSIREGRLVKAYNHLVCRFGPNPRNSFTSEGYGPATTQLT
jgi:hypothetical protein